jgi:ATP-binding cassette subfamily B protein
VLSEASKTGVSMGRLKEILDEEPERDSPEDTEPPMNGDVVFENVSFSYGGEPVLSGVSFTARAGRTLGILGGTGSGKTTAVHLLCRLYDLPAGQGRITVGGVDITRIKRSWLRKNIGIVLQEPFLFSRTIRENIASLSPAHGLESIKRAARISQIEDSISGFTMGYDTVVGERGVTLSGGQKQRVAIARAIINNPPVMIFDDSLSAVDTETDTKIRAALREMTGGVTTIIIAHRITSISRADKIIVLERGRVAEEGTHSELIALGGIYRRVHDLQSSIEDSDGTAEGGGGSELL